MTHEIVVPEVCVHVVTSSTLYPAEGGFAGIFAEIVTRDKTLTAAFENARREGRTITLRCAMLGLIGQVTSTTSKGTARKIVVSVDDLDYRKPNPTAHPQTDPLPLKGADGT